jgi:ABC-type glycerol-3-phosphate transport system substrate-binding protein
MKNKHNSRSISLRALVAASLLLALAVVVAACQPSAPTEAPPTEAEAAPTTAEVEAVPPAEEARTLTVWGFVWTADWLDAIAPQFEAEHPGVTVEVGRFEYDAYQDMVLTTLASGEGVPDVATLDPMWAGDLIRGGTVLPLDKAGAELNVGDFVPGGWNLYAWQGVQYGVPLDLDFNLLFYRKDIYAAAMETLGMTEFPTTTEDYLKLAEEVVKETGKPAVIIYQNDYYSWYQSFLAPMGGNLINDAGTEYIFNSEAGAESLQLYADVVNTYKVGKLWDWDVDGDPMVALSGGDVMGVMHGSWFATEIASGAPDMAGQWAIASGPWGGADRPFDAATGGACLSIPTGAPNPDLAWEFLKFAMTPENQVEYFKIVGGVPSLKTSWSDPAFDEINEYFGIPLGRSVANWSLRAMPMQLPSMEVSDLIGEAIVKATTGQATPKEALDEAVDMAPPLE